MKAISSTFLALAFSVCASFLSLTTVQAQAAAPQAQQAAPAKKSFFSRFRRNPAPVAPQAQAAPQQQVQQAPQRRQFRLPTFRKPDLSRIPKPKLPKFSKPKVSMPKVNMPKFKWPFNRQASGQVVQEYPNGVRNPKLGGAYGVIQDDQVKFYEMGPSQPGGADTTLSRGSLVTIRSNDRAWAYVTLKDGQSGYIGLDQVRMASAKESPKPPAPKPKKRRTKKRKSSNYVAKEETKEDYTPPALPTAAVELPESPEVNPLLRKVTPEETVSSSVEPIGLDEDLVDTAPAPQPVDSPEVLFDPILDPLAPSAGGPRPFLSDPIPSIEEELRAIQAAKAPIPAPESDGS